MFLYNQQVTGEIKREIKKFLETTMKTQQLKTYSIAAKAFLRGTFTALQSYLKRQEKHWIDRLTLHLKQLEKEEQKKLVKGKKS